MFYNFMTKYQSFSGPMPWEYGIYMCTLVVQFPFPPLGEIEKLEDAGVVKCRLFL